MLWNPIRWQAAPGSGLGARLRCVLGGALIAGLSAVALAAGVTSAQAVPLLTVTSAVGGAPTGINYVNFDDLLLGGLGGPASGPFGSLVVSMNPDAAAVIGASSGLYAAPFLSASNGLPFLDATVIGADTTTYLTSGNNSAVCCSTAQIKLVFPGQMLYMGLLWGSVDLYNTLTFYDGATLLGSVTGGDVVAGANGDQGVFGTYYVNINSDTPFNTVFATSSQYAFEFDNVSYNATNPGIDPVPLPAAVWLLGSALLGMGFFRRRGNGTGTPVEAT